MKKLQPISQAKPRRQSSMNMRAGYQVTLELQQLQKLKVQVRREFFLTRYSNPSVF